MVSRRQLSIGERCAALALAASSLVAAGCDNGTPSHLEGADAFAIARAALEGPVEVDGSSTVYLMSEAAARAFAEEYPRVKVSVGKSGTGGGFKRFVTGEIDVAGASRPIKQDELELAAKNGVEFLELPVAYDGLTIAVNKDNDWASEITIDQLKKIFLSDAPAETWKDVDPGWPDLEIKVYSPGADSGTYDYFKEVVAGKQGTMRDDMSLSEDDNNLLRGIEGDRGAIGYFGAAYYFSDQERLKALKVVDPATGEAVAVDPATIKSGQYAPFSRPLFIYVNVERMNTPQVEAFIDFYLEYAGELAREVQYVELPDPVYEAARSHFEEGRSGSRYYDESGQPVHGTLEELFVEDARHGT